ncbi:MAG: hypothetical protein WCO94_05780 [Verrucomicrobiota bacterium]
MKSALCLIIAVFAAGWFFFQAQTRLSDWRTDVATNQKHLEECIDQYSVIWDNFGIYTGALTAFQQSLDCNDMIIEANDRRFELLSHKPFGLSLSESELQKLNKARMAKADLQKVKKDLIANIEKEIARLKKEHPELVPKVQPSATPQPATSVASQFPPGVDTPEQRREFLLKRIEAQKAAKRAAPYPAPPETSNRTRGY